MKTVASSLYSYRTSNYNWKSKVFWGPLSPVFGKKHKKFNAPKNDSIVVKYYNLGDLSNLQVLEIVRNPVLFRISFKYLNLSIFC